ncbi:MAG TPA: M13 family metallopeptidase N-terminal domain-containing protein, partial [Chitinophagaceae bacterium]|nr:M13 family metallopeptidase N-terminal domain-containing protein [Chitinophagaceae bacterium]
MKPMVKLTLLGAALAGLAFMPGAKPTPKEPKYIDKAYMDFSVKPGDNFYRYVNGGWLKSNPIPGSKTRWGSFDVLRDESTKRMQALLTDAVKKGAGDARMKKIGDFYTSGMDTAVAEALGYTPIKTDLQRIDGITDIQGLLNEIAYSRTQGISGALFGFSLAQDRKNVSQYIPQLAQGGTTLPDRDYYIKTDARSTTVRIAYIQHVKNMFALVGEN